MIKSILFKDMIKIIYISVTFTAHIMPVYKCVDKMARQKKVY